MSRHRSRAGLLLAGLLAVLPGCEDDPVGPVTEPVAFDPPAAYTVLWEEVESCAGTDGSMDGIRWFVTTDFSRPGVLGQWSADRRIVLRVDVWNDWEVVKHEMLHDLLSGDGDHADPAWAACELPVGVDG